MLLLLLSTPFPATAEQRLAYSPDSPAWLQAVGKLRVPGSQFKDGRRKHRLEDCSATLIAATPASSEADVVITAWHCLEFYNDLSRPILFTLLPQGPAPVTREAYRVADGGGMHADWALLKLREPVPAAHVAGLVANDGSGPTPARVTMAGYSRDKGLGERGNVLTYHPYCAVTQWQSGESDCSAFKGASGGAVVKLSASGQASYAGVISRGNSEDISIFVPVTEFRTPLNRALR